LKGKKYQKKQTITEKNWISFQEKVKDN